MANGWDVSKETFVDADPKTQAGLLYDGLSAILTHNAKQPIVCESRHESCQKEFASQKDTKWLTWGVRSVWGVFIVVLIGWIVRGLVP